MIVRVDDLAAIRRRAARAPVEVGTAALLPLGRLAAVVGRGRLRLGFGRGRLGRRRGRGHGKQRRWGGNAVVGGLTAGAAAGEHGRAGDGVLARGRHGVDVDQDAGVVGLEGEHSKPQSLVGVYSSETNMPGSATCLVDARDAIRLGVGGARSANNVNLGAFHL